MHAVLIHQTLLGREYTIMSYTFFLVLAAAAAVGLSAWIARMRGLPATKSAICLSAGLVVMLIAARLVHRLTDPASFSNAGAVFSLGRTNLSAFAGLLLAVPAAAIVARLLHLSAWRLADSSAPALALAVALARTGCLLNGCCFGVPTAGSWGIRVAAGSEAHQAQIVSGSVGLFDPPLPVHPTQLYEIAAAIIGGLIALYLLRRSHSDGWTGSSGKSVAGRVYLATPLPSPDGEVFLIFVLWYTSCRWVISNYLYTPPSFIAPHWLYPALYAVVSVGCCILLSLRNHGPWALSRHRISSS